ncbi:recombinase family protein [Yoonia sp. GPGPB17]|uniref:recombinase family protein n=1 Tax=Yoonia sp. GPGPB17 TaxID=3026147 RepID=UPI0030C468B1
MQHYFGYTRVSTVKQGDGVSLEAQRDAITAYANKQRLSVCEWFEEKETAAKRGRPVFSQLVARLRAGEASGLIIHKIDRSARNFSDWAMIGELIDDGIDVRFAHESLDMQSRGGRLTADIQAVIAADYVRNLREECIKGIEGRLKQGLFPFNAPIGYLDNGPGKPKTPDPQRAPFICQAFELYATQKYSVRSLLRELNRRGLRNRNDKPVTKYGLENILKNHFYYGTILMHRTGRTYQGVHEPIISKALFDKVQSLKGDRHQKKHVVHDHPYRRLLTCGHCNRSLYGEVQKGHVYMRCQTPGCPTTSIRQDRLEAEIVEKLQSVQLPAGDFDKLKARLSVLIKRQDSEADHRAIRLQLDQLRTREEKLTDALIDGLIDKTVFGDRKQALETEQQRLTAAQAELADSKANARLGEQFLELIRNLCLTYRVGDHAQKRRIVEIAFSNRLLTGKNLCLKLQNWCLNPESTLGVLFGPPDQTTTRTRDQIANVLERFDI